MTQYSYGVMQGRLSPPEPGRFQAFPRTTWRDEFRLARQVGFSYIEWIDDGYGQEVNPIFCEGGLAEMEKLKAESEIGISAICADWFMDFPLIRCSPTEREEREQHLRTLIPLAHRIGASRIVLPFVDQARIITEDEKATVIAVLRQMLPLARDYDVELHLEADFNPPVYTAFLERVPDSALKVNWDSGNSSGLGYVATQEFHAYGDRIGSIHIKDRLRKPDGGVETRPLGMGSANFADVFRAMRSIDYTGGLTLQVARGNAGEEADFLRKQMQYLHHFIGAS